MTGYPPKEHRPEVQAVFSTLGCNTSGCQYATDANPYLRWPVLLDEYIKNRDIWRCPSAKVEAVHLIVNPYGGDWWARLDWLYQKYGKCGGFFVCDWP